MNGANQAPLLNIHANERAASADGNLVTTTLANSPGAFAELYTQYSRRLYKTIIAITKHSEDAEDALQETFLRAYMAIHTFEGRSSVYSWLSRIAINSALLVLRKRRARSEILFDPQPDTQAETFSLDVADSSPTPEQIYDMRRRRVALIRAIHNLDEKLRTPIEMHLQTESSMKEIGQALNISESAVKTRLHRARRRLSAACRES